MGGTHQGDRARGNGGPVRVPGPAGSRNGSAEGHPGTGAIAPGGGWLRGGEAEFLATIEAIRAELAPAGPIEGLLMDRLILAARRLRRGAAAEDAGAFDVTLLLYEAFAERSLLRSLRALERCRGRRGRAEPAVAPIPADPEGDDVDSPAMDDTGSWLGRLSFDLNISAESPVVRGTWVTVTYLVSLVVDGWTWTDILRSHPELNEEDIRACLAYHVHEDHGDPHPAD